MMFAAPLWLWLLPFVLLPWLWLRSSRTPHGTMRLLATLALASLALGCTVLALARPFHDAPPPTTRIAVVTTEQAAGLIADWRERTPHSDPFFVVRAAAVPVVGMRGSTQIPAAEGMPDLARALRLADALGGDAAAILVATDGSDHGADLAGLAGSCSQHGRVLHVRRTGPPPPLRLDVRHPPSVASGDALELHVRAHSDAAGPAQLRVREGGRLLLESPLQLVAGTSAHRLHVVPQRERGTTVLDLELAAADRSLSQRTAVEIDPPLRVHRLGDGSAAALRETLVAARIEVVDLSAEQLADPEQLRGADVVLLDDFPAERLGPSGQQALATAVQELGTGLVVAGGAVALSSLVDTPLAELLPVELEPREERRDPSVALVIILDTSGSMGGTRIELAKEVARLATRRLLPHDKVGIVEFYGSRRWAAPLQPASNLIEITRALNRLQAGGGTIIYSAIEEAYYAMLNARTRFKHILVLTDGGVENAPFEPLARRIADSGVQLHTVLIGPQANSPFLVNLAQWGRGRFYACPSRFQLPELRFKEPQSAPLSSQLEAPPPIRRAGLHEVADALGERTLPAPRGLVAARLRPGATAMLRSGESPFLAGWDQGAGRVLVFCSELLGPTAEELRTDPGHAAIVASSLRHAARARAARRAQLELRAWPAALQVRVSQVPSPTWPAPRLFRVGDGGRAVAMQPQQPGCYEAWLDLPADRPTTVDVELPDGTHLRGAAIAPQSPRARDAWPQLAELASISAGTSEGPVPATAVPGTRRPVELARWFVLLALAAFVLGLLVRRWPARATALLLASVLVAPAATQQDPDDAEIRARLAAHGDPDRLLQELAGAPLSTRIAAARATGRLELALVLTQNQPDLLGLRAELLEALGRPAEAIAAWTAWLARTGHADHERAHALVRRALLRDPRREREQLRSELREAGSLADDGARHALGHLAGQLGLFDLALQWHRVELAAAGREYLVALRRGRWQEASEDPDAALTSLGEAVRLARTSRDRRFALAEWVATARRQHALPALATAWLAREELGPEQTDALLELLRELGRAGEALALVARSPHARPELAFAIALEAGAGERAVALGREQLARTPQDVRLRSALALLLTDLDRREPASALLRDGIALADRRRDIVQLGRAALDLGLGDATAAGIERLRASGDPDDAVEALVLAVEASLRRGGREDALAAVRAARGEFAAAPHRVRVGELFEQLDCSDDAIAEYRAALESSNAEDLALRLAWMLARSRKPEEREQALALFRRVWLGAGSAARRAQVEEQVLDLAAREGTLADLALELEAALEDPAQADREAKRDALVKIYTRAKDSLGAVQILRELSREPGREIEAWERIARVHLQNEEFRAHEHALRKLIELDPGHELDWRQQLAMSALERGRPADARAVIEEMVGRPDADEIAFEFAAGIYALAGRHADAARIYRQTLARHPQRIETLLLLGGALERIGRSDEAAGIFLDQLLRPVPDDLLLVAADGLLNVRAPDGALRCAVNALRRRLAATPDRVHLWRMLQDLLETLGDRDARAAAMQATVLVAGEQRAPFVRELMDEARNEKRWQDYVAHGRLLLALGDEMPPSVFVDLGEALVQVGDLGAAERAFERARLASDFAAIERRVAEVYEKAGRMPDAARIWRRILRRDATDQKAMFALAQLEERLGQRSSALARYQEVAIRRLDSLAARSPERGSPSVRRAPPASDDGPAAALDGVLRCAASSAEMGPLLDALRPRLQAGEPARAAAALELFARLVRALADPALTAELRATETRLLAARPAAELATAIARSRAAAGDLDGALAALPDGQEQRELRFALTLLRRDFAAARELAAAEAPQVQVGRIRELLLAGARSEAEALAVNLQAMAEREPDKHGSTWVAVARSLGRAVDDRGLREQRLAKALAEPPARRLQATLSALRGDPELPAEDRAEALRRLLPLVRADADANQTWSFVSYARHHLPAAELTDLIEKCLTGLTNPTLVFTRLDLLPMLPGERQREVVTAVVQAAEPGERDQLRLRILTAGSGLDAETLAGLIQPLDLRNPAPLERTMFRLICLESELTPAAAAAIGAKIAASGEPVLPALFEARTREGDVRMRALRRAVREYTARLEVEPADGQLLDRLLSLLPPEAGDWPEITAGRTATAKTLRLRWLERTGKPAAALADARALFAARPDQRSALDDLLRLLAAAGDVDGQVQALTLHLDRVATVYPYQANELAQLLLELGRPREALAALNRADDTYGYGLSARLQAIVALSDPAERRQLGRAWVQDRQTQARNRRMVFVSPIRRTRRGATLAEVLREPTPGPLLVEHGPLPEQADPVQLLARIPEGEELVRSCLRPLADAERDSQPELYRALVGAARKSGRVDALLGDARAQLAAQPFAAEALRVLYAAAELGVPVEPELIEREVQRRLLLGPTNRLFEAEAYFVCRSSGLEALAQRLLSRLSASRSLLMDQRLGEVLPVLLRQLAARDQASLLSLLPGGEGASPTFDSELLAAILATPDLCGRIDEIAGRSAGVAAYLANTQPRAWRDRLGLVWFGVSVARGDLEGARMALGAMAARAGTNLNIPPHLLAAAVPELRCWKDPDSWRATGELLLASAGDPALRDFPCELGVLLAVRLHQAGRSSEARAWLQNVAPLARGDRRLQDWVEQAQPAGQRVRVATFNASLFRDRAGGLAADLAGGEDVQARAVAEVVQRVRPDVLLLQEFDYQHGQAALRSFEQEYLGRGQQGAEPIAYPFVFSAPVNTGVPTGLDLDHDGGSDGPGDAAGYGRFPGQYGMVVLSRFPLLLDRARTFRELRWEAMPESKLPRGWYDEAARARLPLSSKSHWDLPVRIGSTTLHLLCSHPTPPVFDGEEDRNGRRNHDEIRFWANYVVPDAAGWIHDDRGRSGGLGEDAKFVILGDLNCDPHDGDSTGFPVRMLLEHPRVQPVAPLSDGGKTAAGAGGKNAEHRGDPAHDTCVVDPQRVGNLRLDYVLPSKELRVTGSGVFWPLPGDPVYARLIGADGRASSDHRLVWVELESY